MGLRFLVQKRSRGTELRDAPKHGYPETGQGRCGRDHSQLRNVLHLPKGYLRLLRQCTARLGWRGYATERFLLTRCEKKGCLNDDALRGLGLTMMP